MQGWIQAITIGLLRSLYGLVPGSGGSSSLTSPTLTTPNFAGLGLFAEGAGIRFDAALSADGAYSGFVQDGTAGAALTFGQTVYRATTGKWVLTDADAVATSGGVQVAIVVLAAAGDASATRVMHFGNIRADAQFPTFTVGGAVVLSGTAGEVLNIANAPVATDSVTRIVAHAEDANTLFWFPDGRWTTHT